MRRGPRVMSRPSSLATTVPKGSKEEGAVSAFGLHGRDPLQWVTRWGLRVEGAKRPTRLRLSLAPRGCRRGRREGQRAQLLEGAMSDGRSV